MQYPHRFEVVHQAVADELRDSHGNPVEGFDDPTSRRVIAIYPPAPADIIREEQTGQVWHLELLYQGEPWGAHGDLVTIYGVTYKVRGNRDDFTHSPWGFPGGYRLKLRRVNG